jgi:hypothetical protein
METKNVKFVAFLRLQDIYPSKVEKFARGKAKYIFADLTPDKWNQLKLDFDRSDYLKYAQALDSVVDLAY